MPDTPHDDVAVSISDLLANTEAAPNGCRLWLGPIAVSGLPAVHIDNKTFRVSREVYTATYGPIAKHLQIEAWCGQPRCVNPDHLRQTIKAMSCKPIVGVPLPKGQSLKSAGYKLVHRRRGVSVWEPADIALAVNTALVNADCEECGKHLTGPRQQYCGDKCKKAAYFARRAANEKSGQARQDRSVETA